MAEGDKADVGRRAAVLYEKALDHLEEVLAGLESEQKKGEHVSVIVGVLRGVELVLRALERTRSEAAEGDLAGTLSELMRAWREKIGGGNN